MSDDTLDGPRPCSACGRSALNCRCAQWCEECGCRTNHTTRQHEEAAAR